VPPTCATFVRCLACFRYHVLRLMPRFSHGFVLVLQLANHASRGLALAALRLRHLRSASLRLRWTSSSASVLSNGLIVQMASLWRSSDVSRSLSPSVRADGLRRWLACG
jgi:hypothetical protein